MTTIELTDVEESDRGNATFMFFRCFLKCLVKEGARLKIKHHLFILTTSTA